jgi:hypothetical protein
LIVAQATFIHSTARRALDQGRSPVDGELRLAVQNDEHLLHGVVKMLADAGLRRQHAPVQEKKVRLEIRGVQQRREGHRAGPAVNRRRRPVARRVGVADPLRQRIARHERCRAKNDQRNNAHFSLLVRPR